MIFEKKSIIKKYNKNDIKVNNKYILCENFREDENYDELATENIVKYYLHL